MSRRPYIHRSMPLNIHHHEAVSRRHRRACALFVLLATLGPAVIAVVFKLLSV